MKSTVFIFVPVETSREGFARQLRECLASLDETPSPESVEAVQPETKPVDEPQPFWTWFIPNPRPEKS